MKGRQRSGYPLISAMQWWPCQLYGQFAPDSRKIPSGEWHVEEVGYIFRPTEFCSSKTVSLLKKQFACSLWVLAAAQGDCSVPLHIPHLASSKSSGVGGEKRNLHQFLAATHICLERYAPSLSLLISAWGKSSLSGWGELVLHLGNKPV